MICKCIFKGKVPGHIVNKCMQPGRRALHTLHVTGSDHARFTCPCPDCLDNTCTTNSFHKIVRKCSTTWSSSTFPLYIGSHILYVWTTSSNKRYDLYRTGGMVGLTGYFSRLSTRGHILLHQYWVDGSSLHAAHAARFIQSSSIV